MPEKYHWLTTSILEVDIEISEYLNKSGKKYQTLLCKYWK